MYQYSIYKSISLRGWKYKPAELQTTGTNIVIVEVPRFNCLISPDPAVVAHVGDLILGDAPDLPDAPHQCVAAHPPCDAPDHATDVAGQIARAGT